MRPAGTLPKAVIESVSGPGVETVSPPISGQPASSAACFSPAAKAASQLSVQPFGKASASTKPSGTASALRAIEPGGSSGKKCTPATSASAVTTIS